MLIIKYWELDFVNCTAAAAAFEKMDVPNAGRYPYLAGLVKLNLIQVLQSLYDGQQSSQ